MKSFRRFFRDESGVTAIEYGLIAALIGIAAIIAMRAVGTSINNTFTGVTKQLR